MPMSGESDKAHRHSCMQYTASYQLHSLRRADDQFIKTHMGIVGLRLVMELRGLSCLQLEQCPPPKKGITCARSFGRAITQLQEMEQAVSSYVTRAAEKLRTEELARAQSHGVYAHQPV